MRRLALILALAGCNASALADPSAQRRPTQGQVCSKIPCAGDLMCCEGEYEIAYVKAKRCEGKGPSCDVTNAPPSSCLPKPECVRRMRRNRTKS